MKGCSPRLLTTVVTVRESEGERESERDKRGMRERETDRQRDRETERQRDRESSKKEVKETASAITETFNIYT